MTSHHDAFLGNGRSIILMGGGGHAAVVADAARGAGWNVVGFVSDDDPNADGLERQQRADLVRLGSIAALGEVLAQAPRGSSLVPAVGDGGVRATWLSLAASLGAKAPVVVHHAAIVSRKASLDAGVFVGPGAVIGPRAIVRAGAIINTAAVVEHDVEVGACAHVAPGAVLTGGVVVGERVLVGARAVVIPERVIGAGAVVAAGAVVTQDVEPGWKVAGCPARRIESTVHSHPQGR